MALEGLSDHALHERFELLRGAEHHKNDLIMVVAFRSQLQKVILDVDNVNEW